MHSFDYRANALLTFSLTILVLIYAMASVFDNLDSQYPFVTVEVLNVNRFQKKSKGDDEVGITSNLQTYSRCLRGIPSSKRGCVSTSLRGNGSTSRPLKTTVKISDGVIESKASMSHPAKAETQDVTTQSSMAQSIR